jgi:hypothetical protein
MRTYPSVSGLNRTQADQAGFYPLFTNQAKKVKTAIGALAGSSRGDAECRRAASKETVFAKLAVREHFTPPAQASLITIGDPSAFVAVGKDYQLQILTVFIFMISKNSLSCSTLPPCRLTYDMFDLHLFFKGEVDRNSMKTGRFSRGKFKILIGITNHFLSEMTFDLQSIMLEKA